MVTAYENTSMHKSSSQSMLLSKNIQKLALEDRSAQTVNTTDMI